MADDDDSDGNGAGSGGQDMLVWDIASSSIASLAYDRNTGEAVYTFVRGPMTQDGPKVYRTPMSIQRATAWAYSLSPGEYFNENIKGLVGGNE